MKYLPIKISEIASPVMQSNGEYMTYDGKKYYGPYFVIAEDVYPGTPETVNITRLPNRLIRANDDKLFVEYTIINKQNKRENLYLSTLTPKSYKPSPTEKDYKKGWIYRYFCVKRNEKNIIEIDAKQFEHAGNRGINQSLYLLFRIKWVITGKQTDKYIPGTTYRIVKSVSTQNSEEIKKHAGLSDKLKILDEFAIYEI